MLHVLLSLNGIMIYQKALSSMINKVLVWSSKVVTRPHSLDERSLVAK